MKIRIPDLNHCEKWIENKKSIILIGANGSGKTRMSVWIDEKNSRSISVHRVSAQKNLNLPNTVSPKELISAEENFLYGMSNENKDWLVSQGKYRSRWGSSPITFQLNDYQQLMEYLMTENYEKSIEYREKHKEGDTEFDNTTKLEKIKKIWENVILHKKIKISAGKIEVSNKHDENLYNGSVMSDGERAIFHFIGEVLCAKRDSLIIIDEPENHLHKSILIRLWNEIEVARPDCVFLYITHDLDFANSRINSQIIWVKEMKQNDIWEYCLLNDVDNNIDNLKLEIMGNRHKILLVEGTKQKSIDRKLYSKIYPEYNILPMESCNAVIQTTKAYNRTSELHYSEIKGIVDRDRRGEHEIRKLLRYNIYVPEVAEVENLFLIPDVIRIVAEKQDKQNVDEIINLVKEEIIEFLKNHIEEQALLFTKQKFNNIVLQILNETALDIEQYEKNLERAVAETQVRDIFEVEKDVIRKIVDSNDYLEALKIINDKGLLSYTKLPNEFGWKKDYYIDYVLLLLGKDDEIGKKLKNIFIQHIAEI